jgi:7-dehydrocholesterol reductase
MTTKKIKSGDWSGGDGLLPGREALGPLFLMAVTPNFVMVFYHVVAKMDGDFLAFGKLLIEEGFWNVMRNIWPNCWDPVAWKLIAGFFAFELLLMRLLPGKTCTTTLTPKGNLPVYTANGMQAYFVTLIVFLGLTYFGYIRPALVYDKFGEILASLNIFALFFCTLLLIKGHVAPSTTDSGSTGSFIYDFYWGMELYPRILGFDVKMFTNCRAGMMFWAVGILCFAHKNMEVNAGVLNLGMAVNVALQLIYITKFFLWEMGYMASMDIQHDRAGKFHPKMMIPGKSNQHWKLTCNYQQDTTFAGAVLSGFPAFTLITRFTSRNMLPRFNPSRRLPFSWLALP